MVLSFARDFRRTLGSSSAAAGASVVGALEIELIAAVRIYLTQF
jgi:hypothetical protein